MKLQPVTLGLVLVAAVLSGFVYFSQVHSNPQPEAATTQKQKLFGFEEKQVKSFTLKTQLRSLAFAREQGKWQMLVPEKTPASESTIAYLLNLLVTASSDRTIATTTIEQKDFGFDQPMAVIEVKLDNQETHRLVLGGYDFNRSNLYAQADTPDQTTEVKVQLVSPGFDNAVNRALADWKSATNSAVPTPTGSPNASPPNASPPNTSPPQTSTPTPNASTLSTPGSGTPSTAPKPASPSPAASAKP
jgi:Domain of unknown function (DUF4340)